MEKVKKQHFALTPSSRNLAVEVSHEGIWGFFPEFKVSKVQWLNMIEGIRKGKLL